MSDEIIYFDTDKFTEHLLTLNPQKQGNIEFYIFWDNEFERNHIHAVCRECESEWIDVYTHEKELVCPNANPDTILTVPNAHIE